MEKINTLLEEGIDPSLYRAEYRGSIGIDPNFDDFKFPQDPPEPVDWWYEIEGEIYEKVPGGWQKKDWQFLPVDGTGAVYLTDKEVIAAFGGVNEFVEYSDGEVKEYFLEKECWPKAKGE